jgi:hypothetical protein
MTMTGGVFDLMATILKGPNPAFRRKQVQLTQPLDASRLYLLHDSSRRALELVPLIRVLTTASGQDACYFYSRLDGPSIRWVSYHFHAQPELTLPDAELSELLLGLASPVPTSDLTESATTIPQPVRPIKPVPGGQRRVSEITGTAIIANRTDSSNADDEETSFWDGVLEAAVQRNEFRCQPERPRSDRRPPRARV